MLQDFTFPLVLSLGLLAAGLLGFAALLTKYREKLLNNFHQKVFMTVALGITSAATILFLNISLFRELDTTKLIALFGDPKTSLLWYFRLGLAFVIGNAILLLALRSIIKAVYRARY